MVNVVLEENVKPCPKCGSTRYIVKSHYDVFIECKSCGLQGPKAEKLHQAIKKWNRMTNGEADGR